MSKLLLDLVNKKCKIIILGIFEIKGTIIDMDDTWIKLKLKKEKIRFIRKSIISSINYKENI